MTKNVNKLIRTCILIIAAITITTEAHAQFSAGGGLFYGLEIERAGLRADGVYSINENLRAAANVGFYFPETVETPGYSSTHKWLDLNANVHYLFVNDEEWNVYGLAGINYLNFSYSDEFDAPPGTVVGEETGTTVAKSYNAVTIESSTAVFSASQLSSDNSISETGLNIGIGGEYKISFGTAFGELKYAGIGGDADQLVLGIGVRYNF